MVAGAPTGTPSPDGGYDAALSREEEDIYNRPQNIKMPASVLRLLTGDSTEAALKNAEGKTGPPSSQYKPTGDSTDAGNADEKAD